LFLPFKIKVRVLSSKLNVGKTLQEGQSTIDSPSDKSKRALCKEKQTSYILLLLSQLVTYFFDTCRVYKAKDRCKIQKRLFSKPIVYSTTIRVLEIRYS
jgi:hypothetical protein